MTNDANNANNTAGALPSALPGRESDADVNDTSSALDAIRAQIAQHVESTQGAWAKKSMMLRMWPVLLSLTAAIAWAANCLVAGGAMRAAAFLAGASAVAAFVAVARAPLHPGSSEKTARIALAIGCLALAAEIGLAYFAPPAEGGTDMQCASAIVIGALIPAGLLAYYLRTAQAPARLFHVVAIAGAAFLASAAAVWAECPGTKIDHVLMAHAAAPLLVAAVVVLLMRPMLKGAPVPRR